MKRTPRKKGHISLVGSPGKVPVIAIYAPPTRASEAEKQIAIWRLNSKEDCDRNEQVYQEPVVLDLVSTKNAKEADFFWVFFDANDEDYLNYVDAGAMLGKRVVVFP